MSTRRYLTLLIVLTFITLLAVACGGNVAEPEVNEVAEESAPAEVAEEEQEAEQAAPSDAIPCEFDEQTCQFLEGKDFSGQTLVVGVWGGVIEEILREIVIPPLEARGATVELLLGGTGDRLAKIYAERGNPTMDVAYLNIYEAPQAMADGVTEAPSSDVPAYDDLYPLAQKGGYGVSFMGLGIAYNVEAFDSPPEWADLWKPEYVGKIAFPTYPGSESDGILAVAGRLAGADEHDADAAFAKLAELKPVPLTYTNLDELFLLMEKGDVVAAPVISGYAWTYKDRGLPIDFSWPTDPGPVKMMDVMTIVEGTPNRELALAWAQLALSPRTQEAYAEQIYFGPTNSAVELEDQQVIDRVIYGQEQVDQLVDLDWAYIIEQRPEWTERWNMEIVGN
jgi:putative spermidine/putrescine transport system substrate-binding protein